jgi:pimeloyl-ACP methyl ester carboxylesterase
VSARAWQEFPVFIPLGEERLCSVVCAPAEGGHDLGVVLLTGGNYTRTHRNRMWVRAARELAERGFPSIRVDYHGVGDSTGHAYFDMEAPFDRDALAAAAFLKRATGVRKLAIVATCFGGRSAMAAAAQEPDCVGISIYPVPLTVPKNRQPVPLRSKVRLWMKRFALGTKLLQHPRIRKLRGKAHAKREVPDVVISPRFKKDVVAVLKRGAAVTFVYGELTEDLGHLRQAVAEIEPHVSAEQRAAIVVDLAEGTSLLRFQTLADQDVVVTRSVAFVDSLHRRHADAEVRA